MKTVWSKEHTAVKNITLAFVLDTQASGEGSLSLVASNLYRFFLNGELMGYGPARAAHGYTRRDIYRFSLPEKRKNRLVIEVFSAHVNSFYRLLLCCRATKSLLRDCRSTIYDPADP